SINFSFHILKKSSSCELLKATAYWDSTHKAVLLKEGVLDPQGDAYGYYNDTLTSTGWGVLEIRAGYGQTAEPDDVTMFIAGYLEGFLTAPQIFDHYTNMYPQLIQNPKTLVTVKRFMAKQDEWSRRQVKRNTTDPLWIHTGLILAQLDGLQARVTDWAKQHGRTPLSQFAIQFLNAVGDLLDLIPALVPGRTSGFKQYKAPPMGHCSALIKMLPGFENLLFAHSSWYTYAATIRIYKHWDFRLNEPHTATGRLSFSSYPGFLVSLDDFYLLGSSLMMTQTTNNVFNTSLYSYITPASLLSWQRVRLAHALANTGEQWAKTFSRYNSGQKSTFTYLHKVHLGNSLEDGALTVVEQIPGLVEYSDQTQVLRRGYWPSYNVPFHRKIYDLSGYEEMWKEYGEDFSYDLCSRAKIFRRDQSSVSDLNSLKHIMRYNGKLIPISATEKKKKKECDCDFLSHNFDIFSCNCEFSSRNSDFFLRIVRYKLTIASYKVRIVGYKLAILTFHSCEFVSRNSDFFFFSEL
uniref:Phospholipase B-like n=1 Tax=Sinocyclocheilus rhinocerous TaxID=307959 RepID=A0A673JEK4_9TELE